ncbi:hypothetical protein [Legionella oakridgensis]|uniref:hypothetical protein n=1 Tax=Legionella oakridgensis TaxID=29423 RepID=UPI0004AEBE09|nr:hypothetical protein [Legionella oakridgensis]
MAGEEFVNRVHSTLVDLKIINPDYVITGHCTGRKTQAELSNVFHERHIPYGVGAAFKL